MQELQEKMNELNGAMKICKKMQSRQENFDSFNEDFYWEEIHKQEQAGNKFLEIISDSMEYEKGFVYTYFDLLDDEGNVRFHGKELIFRILEVFFVSGIMYYIFDGLFAGEWHIENLFFGIRNFLIILAVFSIYGLPWYFLKKKCPEIAREYGKLGYGIELKCSCRC